MKYVSFSFENYKGIKEPLKIDVFNGYKNPICVVGNNESGKTTILKGIDFIGKLIKGDYPKVDELNTIYPRSQKFDGKVVLGVEVKLEEAEKGALLFILEDVMDLEEIGYTRNIRSNFERALDKNNNKIGLSFTFQFENNIFSGKKKKGGGCPEIGYVLPDFPKGEEIPLAVLLKEEAPEVVYFDGFSLDIPKEIIFLKSYEFDENNESLKNHKLFHKLVSEKNEQWKVVLNDLYLATLKSETKTSANFQNDLVDWQYKNPQDKNTIETRLEGLNKKLNEIIPPDWSGVNESSVGDNVSFTIRRETENTDKNVFHKFSIKVKSDEDIFELIECSKGRQWYFSFCINTILRTYRNKNGVLFLLDEPANNLHVYPQQKILENISRLPREEISKSCAIVYSTHSPALIDIKKRVLNETLIVVNKKKSEGISHSNIVSQKYADFDKNDSLPLRPIREKQSVELVDEFQKNLGKIKKKGKDDKEILKKTGKKFKKFLMDGLDVVGVSIHKEAFSYCKNFISSLFS